MELFFFYLFGFFLLFCGFNVVFSNHAIYAVFYLVLAFCNSAVLLLLLEVEVLVTTRVSVVFRELPQEVRTSRSKANESSFFM